MMVVAMALMIRDGDGMIHLMNGVLWLIDACSRGYGGVGYSIFNGYYQWDNGEW